MIEGLKIDVSSTELEEHLSKRVEYHTERAEFYGLQVQNLKAGGVGILAQSNDPVSSLEGSEKSHQDKAAFYRFMKDHVIPDETYRLTEQDLVRLEIVSRYF